MDIKDLAGKTVLRGLGPFDLENDREDWCIEFTDGTKVYFSPNPYSTHTTDCEVYPPNASLQGCEQSEHTLQGVVRPSESGGSNAD